MLRTLSALAVATALLFSLPAAAQDTWQIDPPHSSAQFSVRHLGVSTVRGAFTKMSGTVQYDPNNPAKPDPASIDAASVDTRVEMRDNELRGPNYFDVQKYPTITFQSKKIEAAGPGKLKVTGDLTIHGVTKKLSSMWTDQPRHKRSMGQPPLRAPPRRQKLTAMDFSVAGAPGRIGNEITITST